MKSSTQQQHLQGGAAWCQLLDPATIEESELLSAKFLNSSYQQGQEVRTNATPQPHIAASLSAC